MSIYVKGGVNEAYRLRIADYGSFWDSVNFLSPRKCLGLHA